MLTNNDKIWLDETLEKVLGKLSKTTREIKDSIPYTTINGKWDDKSKEEYIPNDCNGIYYWTNGFYPGILWLLYHETKDEYYMEMANKVEDKLDEALLGFEGLHHDVGFMWLLSSVANYRITGNNKSKQRGQIAAGILASRFHPSAGLIRAWNHKQACNWAIIDCMMNIQLLYWADSLWDDDRFLTIANTHADNVIKHFIRDDGSVKHIVEYDMKTGDEITNYGGQGYCQGSSWSRGQSWGIYGFILSYLHTKEQRYLDAAKKIAHYFISCIQDDFIPACDFRAPYEPVIKDSSAGVIAACGLIEIARSVPEYEKNLYLSNAINILKAITEKCADFSLDNQQILNMGTGAYHREDTRHMSLIYADYYYLEALLKLKGNDILLW